MLYEQHTKATNLFFEKIIIRIPNLAYLFISLNQLSIRSAYIHYQ